MLELRGGVVVPDDALAWRFSRSSGPGGQSVNTTDSRVELSVDLVAHPVDQSRRSRTASWTGCARGCGATCSRSPRRSTGRSCATARPRSSGCAALLDEALAPPGPIRRASRPSRASRERRAPGASSSAAPTKQLRQRPPHA